MIRWCRVYSQCLVKERFGVVYHECHVSILLNDLAFFVSTPGLAVWVRHWGMDVSKNFPHSERHYRPSAQWRADRETWLQDEARISQKNVVFKQRVPPNTRPRRPALLECLTGRGSLLGAWQGRGFGTPHSPAPLACNCEEILACVVHCTHAIIRLAIVRRMTRRNQVQNATQRRPALCVVVRQNRTRS